MHRTFVFHSYWKANFDIIFRVKWSEMILDDREAQTRRLSPVCSHEWSPIMATFSSSTVGGKKNDKFSTETETLLAGGVLSGSVQLSLHTSAVGHGRCSDCTCDVTLLLSSLVCFPFSLSVSIRKSDKKKNPFFHDSLSIFWPSSCCLAVSVLLLLTSHPSSPWSDATLILNREMAFANNTCRCTGWRTVIELRRRQFSFLPDVLYFKNLWSWQTFSALGNIGLKQLHGNDIVFLLISCLLGCGFLLLPKIMFFINSLFSARMLPLTSCDGYWFIFSFSPLGLEVDVCVCESGRESTELLTSLNSDNET